MPLACPLISSHCHWNQRSMLMTGAERRTQATMDMSVLNKKGGLIDSDGIGDFH